MVHRVNFRQEHKQKLRIFCQQMVTLRSDMCEQAQYTFRRNQKKCLCEEPDINCSLVCSQVFTRCLVRVEWELT